MLENSKKRKQPEMLESEELDNETRIFSLVVALEGFAKRNNLASFIDVVKNKCCNDEERRQVLSSVAPRTVRDKETVLGTAAENGSISVIDWLLSREVGKGRDCGFVSVLSKDTLGKTALHVAALRYNREAFFAIIDGCDAEEKRMLLRTTTELGETVLHSAAYHNPVVVCWLLSNEPGKGRQSGFDLVLAKDSDKRTALHAAEWEGTFFAMMDGCTAEERRELLNAIDNFGETVLHHAAGNRYRTHIIRWLLSNEAGKGRQLGFNALLARDRNGQTALHYAVFEGLIRGGDIMEEPYAAIMNGYEEDEKKAALKIADNKGRSLLHYAGCSLHRRNIDFLLQYSQVEEKFLNARDHYGMTPLHFAVLGDYAERCPTLYRSDNYGGFPPYTRCMDIVNLLLSRKNIDPNIGIAKIEWIEEWK